LRGLRRHTPWRLRTLQGRWPGGMHGVWWCRTRGLRRLPGPGTQGLHRLRWRRRHDVHELLHGWHHEPCQLHRNGPAEVAFRLYRLRGLRWFGLAGLWSVPAGSSLLRWLGLCSLWHCMPGAQCHRLCVLPKAKLPEMQWHGRHAVRGLPKCGLAAPGSAGVGRGLRLCASDYRMPHISCGTPCAACQLSRLHGSALLACFSPHSC